MSKTLKAVGLVMVGAWVFPFAGSAPASDLDTMGVTQLRALVPSLTGSGVWVAQPEAGPAPNTWQVSPFNVGQPQSLFTWISSNGMATNFPNALGQASDHANLVGAIFYGAPGGVCPGVAHVNSYEVNYFINALLEPQSAIPARVVNQSFIDEIQNLALDQVYDNYVARYNTLFASAVGNGGAPNSPSTAYNVIGVGSATSSSSTGPTLLDGRCKPDITALASLTSFSTPQVAGCAALLYQAGFRGDGGASAISKATNAVTIKCLLLNGAQKPSGWTNSQAHPLDNHYGAGVVNVFNSYRQLCGGLQSYTDFSSITNGGQHLPSGSTNNIPARCGWDFQTINTSVRRDKVNHYFFDLRSSSNRLFTLTATLAWNRELNKPEINNFDLFLYDAANSNLVASSQSTVDNVEHLYVTDLPPSRYNLQVLLNGQERPLAANYALAFEFGPPAPVKLINAAFTGNAFRARLVGEPYTRYLIRTTSNLADWVPAMTNTTSSLGYFDFTNTVANGPSNQFYSANWAP